MGQGAWRASSDASENPEWHTGGKQTWHCAGPGKPTFFLHPSSSVLYPSSVPLWCGVWHRTRHEEPNWATDLSLIGENQKRKMNYHPPCSTRVVNVGGEMKSHGVIHVFMCWKWKVCRQTDKTGEGDIHRMLGRNEKPLWLRATARRATNTCSWSSTSHRKVLSAVLYTNLWFDLDDTNTLSSQSFRTDVYQSHS